MTLVGSISAYLFFGIFVGLLAMLFSPEDFRHKSVYSRIIFVWFMGFGWPFYFLLIAISFLHAIYVAIRISREERNRSRSS